jgi:protein SCO1/2
MNDVQFKGQDLRFALIEASEGRIGTLLDTMLLFNCFQYDPDSNSYSPAAWKLMRAGGVLMLVVLGGGLAVLGFTSSDRLKKSQNNLDGPTS